MTRPRSRDDKGPSDRNPDPRERSRGSGRRGQSRPNGPPRTGPRPPAGTEQDFPDPSAGDARDRVQARLVRIAREYPDLPIGSVDVSGLSSRDAAFAKALEHVILHRWNTLQAIADSQVDRDWRILQGSIRAALLSGTAELLFMDTVPDHAAINETVNRVRRHVHQGAAGLVNAVLRKVAALRGPVLPAGHPDIAKSALNRNALLYADGSMMLLQKPVFSEDEVLRLCQQTSHGEPLVVHWIGAHGLALTRQLCLHDLVKPPVCVTASDPRTLEPFAGEDGALTPHDQPGFFVFDTNALDLSGFIKADPTRRVQDPASAEPVTATAKLRPKVIVDYCAGRGTKTRQLAELHPEAEIFATDVDQRRRNDLRRAFINHPTVQVVDPPGLRETIGRTDLLVLDVPCSNTGVLARRAEARYRFDDETLKSIERLQKSIVRDTEPLLSPSGAILFSTCSLEPVENRRLSHWIGHHFNLELRKEHQKFPSGIPGDPATKIHDGSFHALLVRDSTPKE